MTIIAVQDKYAEILTAFGDFQESVNVALQRYTIEKITTKIKELRQSNLDYRDRYGLEFPVFSQRIAEDEEFIHHIESNINKMWEMDLAEWEFAYKGINDWTRKLQDILLT
ncbi:MAG: hypothetical protein ABIG63_03320 [Chloroflexota bacterium]